MCNRISWVVGLWWEWRSASLLSSQNSRVGQAGCKIGGGRNGERASAYIVARFPRADFAPRLLTGSVGGRKKRCRSHRQPDSPETRTPAMQTPIYRYSGGQVRKLLFTSCAFLCCSRIASACFDCVRVKSCDAAPCQAEMKPRSHAAIRGPG